MDSKPSEQVTKAAKALIEAVLAESGAPGNDRTNTIDIGVSSGGVPFAQQVNYCVRSGNIFASDGHVIKRTVRLPEAT